MIVSSSTTALEKSGERIHLLFRPAELKHLTSAFTRSFENDWRIGFHPLFYYCLMKQSFSRAVNGLAIRWFQFSEDVAVYNQYIAITKKTRIIKSDNEKRQVIY